MVRKKIKISSSSFLVESAPPPSLGRGGGKEQATTGLFATLHGRPGDGVSRTNATKQTSLVAPNGDIIPIIDITELGNLLTWEVWQELVNNNTFLGIDLGTIWPGFVFSETRTWPTDFNGSVTLVLDFLSTLLANSNFGDLVSSGVSDAVSSVFQTSVTNTYGNLFTSPSELAQYYTSYFSLMQLSSLLGALTTNQGPNFLHFMNMLFGQTGVPADFGQDQPPLNWYQSDGTPISFPEMLGSLSQGLGMYFLLGELAFSFFPEISSFLELFYSSPNQPTSSLIYQWIQQTYSQLPPNGGGGGGGGGGGDIGGPP